MNQKISRTSSNAPAIKIDGLSMAFENRLVLNKITLEVPPGQALCLCGINGAGKSTLLHNIIGLLQPTHGLVQINGLEVKKNPQLTKAQIGVISHKSMLYPDLTVAENLSFFARLYGVKNHRQRIEELLEDVGLWTFRHEKTAILSRGMLQRLTIARALVHQPNILLADEPFTGLDLRASRHLIDVFGKFKDTGGTIIMTTHEITFGLKCCHRVTILDQARLIFDAPIDQIDRDSFSKDYLAYARENS